MTSHPWQAATWSVGVVIPARNEAASIERCVASVIRSCDASLFCRSFWIVVVADDCSDLTAATARAGLGHRGEVIECAARSPGTARRLGAAAVLERFKSGRPDQIWLANTDADSYVPMIWIDAHLLHAITDADGLAGIVQLDPVGLRQDVLEVYERTYRVSPDGTHAHIHGANLGVRADAYLAVGGWNDLQVSEDHCLWERLQRAGHRMRASAACVVHTSARLSGRASGGFADALRNELSASE